MKKNIPIQKLFAITLIILGIISCSKDSVKEGRCMSCSYLYNGQEQVLQACEDEEDIWKPYAQLYNSNVETWEEFEEMMAELDSTYDYITCED